MKNRSDSQVFFFGCCKCEESTREGPALVEATGLDTRIRKAAVEEETGAPQVKVVKGTRLLRMLTATRL